jgi:HSP20 family protein
MSDPRRSDPFGDLFGEFSDRLRGDRWQPDVDVFETETTLVVRVELAGVHSRDLRVGVDGSELRISGRRAVQEAHQVQRLHQMEIATGPFERRLRIPVAFDRERVTAHLADGILTIQLPKRARRNVTVERG